MGRSPYPASESGPWVQGTPQVHHDDFVDVSAHLASGGPRLSDAHSRLEAGNSALDAGAGFASDSDRWMQRDTRDIVRGGGTFFQRSGAVGACRAHNIKLHWSPSRSTDMKREKMATPWLTDA